MCQLLGKSISRRATLRVKKFVWSCKSPVRRLRSRLSGGECAYWSHIYVCCSIFQNRRAYPNAFHHLDEHWILMGKLFKQSLRALTV
ncbi:hypothetical protein BDW67DRAFT_167188 [Aspergillus spinulosporus]